MAPERKHRRSGRKHTSVQKGGCQGVVNGVSVDSANVDGTNAAGDHTSATSSRNAALQQPSQTYPAELTQHTTISNTILQASTYATLQSIPRPWAQDAVSSSTLAAIGFHEQLYPVDEVAPIGTWQHKSIDHQSWHTSQGPWAQDASNFSTAADANGITPMLRWQQENVNSQPWHAMQGVYNHNHNEEDVSNSQREYVTNNDGQDINGLQEQDDDMNSMACNASDACGAWSETTF
ncbi:uncharacterized protein PAC_16260 [Phialocephala subalpina]|uniref:Uncharacterized protein n=1 Tax=Phialocephala subalpina TaxID=576137 RepID=A0A1L7XMU5_9HELO|nr:uncharacterized protein PAC_16260 [Phialocephala subalpina]